MGFLVKSEQIGYIASGTRYKGLAFNDSLVNKVGFNVRSDNGFLTVTFDYTKLRFGCDHVSRAVMVYENLGDNLLAFDADKNAYLYNQEFSATFHGVAYECEVDVFVNENFAQPKVFQSVQYQGMKSLNILCDIEANDTYALQETEMPTNLQDILEGSHFVQVRNNKFTGTVKSQAYYMVNGRSMRGNYMRVEFSQTPESIEAFPELSVAIVEYVDSDIKN